jgi:peptidoglycan-N-acetylglucosamine deacetylase
MQLRSPQAIAMTSAGNAPKSGVLIAIGSVFFMATVVLMPQRQLSLHSYVVLDSPKQKVKVVLPSPLPKKLKKPPVKPAYEITQPSKLAAFAGTTVRSAAVANQKLVALTFDDGPWPKTTGLILQILKNYNAKATFFWVGQEAKRRSAITKKVVAAGHALGNHTWNHRYHVVEAPEARRELRSVQQLLQQDLKVTPTLFRPPGGRLHNGLAKEAKRQGYVVVMWSVLSRDTYPDATVTSIWRNVVDGVKPGSIVLMHDGGGRRDKTVKALPKILATLRKRGYRFVTVPELLYLSQRSALKSSSKL